VFESPSFSLNRLKSPKIALSHGDLPPQSRPSVNNKLENILEVLSEFKYIYVNLQEENTTMKRSFEDLTNRNENLMSVSSDLNQRVKDLENERSSLLTAIKLIIVRGAI
jgi:hypothetical protein